MKILLSHFQIIFFYCFIHFPFFPFNNFFLIYVMNRTRWILFFVNWAVEGDKGVGGVSSTLEGVYRIRRFNIFQVCWFRKLMLHKLIWGLNERKFRSKLAVTLPIKNYFFCYFLSMCAIKEVFLIKILLKLCI